MKRIGCAVLSGALVAGCATFGDLDSGLAAMVGHHQSDVFAALGYPSSKLDIGGDTVYYWRSSSSQTLFLPQTHTTTGYVGLNPVSVTTTQTQAIPIHYACEIKVVVGSDGLVKDWDYEGNLGGCESYINRLKAYWKVHEGKT